MRFPSTAIIAGVAAAFMVCFAASGIAQGPSQNSASSSAVLQKPGEYFPSKLGTSVRNGTVMSLNTTRMVIARMHKGKTEQLEFVLNSETVRNDEITVGSQITVHFRIESKQNIATSIQLRKPSPELL